ncbi:MAG: hypothetical protein ABSE62_04725 [Chthoniobacteraceae bacterium]|jgi:hypothetical protein
MKRLVLPLAAALVLAAAGLLLLRHAPQARQVASWLPADTIVYEEMPDIHRSKLRWPQTALAQIIHEPEVQAFLERPLGQLPFHDELDKRLDQIGNIDPTRFFFAVTDWNGSTVPKVIVGLSYSGGKDALDALVGDLRAGARSMWPEGKSDIETYASGEIETFTSPGFSAGLAYRGKWLFIATDVDLLKSTLDRFEGKETPDNLAQAPAYKMCVEHLPSAPDNIFFIRPGMLADKMESLALMLDPTANLQGGGKFKRMDSMGFALKMDGELMRDAAYIVESQPGDNTPLAGDVLKLSSTATIVVSAQRMGALPGVQLPDPKADPTGMFQILETYLKAFSDQGLGVRQFAQAFGPETGFLLDWPAGSIIPSPLLMMDVRDPAMARKFMDTLSTLPLTAGVGFARHDAGGISYYSLPPSGIGILSFEATLGLTGKCVIAALSPDAVAQGVRRWSAGGAGLRGTTPYQTAIALVPTPTMSFSYLDTKAIFDRVYGPIRTFGAVASMGFVPHLSDYVDIGKLPAPETIRRHLSPMTSSATVRDGGLLIESTGPITTTQTAIAAGVLLTVSAVPLIEQEMKGQSFNFPNLPGFPGLNSGQGNSGQSPFAMPWGQGASTPPAAPAPPVAPSVPAASASPSAGTP